MKIRFYIALVLGIAVLCLCQCRKTPFCYSVPQDFWNDYFPYEKEQTVTFCNEFGETKIFIVKDVYVDLGIYEPFTDDAHPLPHCSSGGSVLLSGGDENIRLGFDVHGYSSNVYGYVYEKGEYGYYYLVQFDQLGGENPGANTWWVKSQVFTNQQFGKIKSLYKIYGKSVEFEKESFGGTTYPNPFCSSNIVDVKCERGKGLSQFRDDVKGCTWKLSE
ncbi:MAG: hypothetical protein PUB29_09570 [Bacteroidales bacterium]|nr:hypothetical protein [Bacteroidales bacterium]